MAGRGLSLIPLWKRKIPRYPLHYRGDPQLKITLPLFWMKMVKPKEDIPADHVHFIVHPQMSKNDVRQYLEKIYDVPVLNVRTELRQGKRIRNDHFSTTMWREEDEKYAYVQLAKDVFKFPSLFREGEKSQFSKDMELTETRLKQRENDYHSNRPRQGLPPWFR